jgi:uncharacterized membrane protein YkoI
MRRTALAAFIALTTLLVAPALANISRDEAVAIAQRKTKGRVLSIQKAQSSERDIWRIKIVTASGEIKVIMVDMKTGESH